MNVAKNSCLDCQAFLFEADIGKTLDSCSCSCMEQSLDNQRKPLFRLPNVRTGTREPETLVKSFTQLKIEYYNHI